MDQNGLIASLAAQAASEGREIAALRALVEEASEAGAARALERIGLSDDAARGDIADLRELLTAWRDAKKSAWKAAIDWLVRGMLAAILIGIAVKMGHEIRPWDMLG